MNLDSLPQINFCETDTAKVEQQVIALHEQITGRVLYPGDPERLFVEAVAHQIARRLFDIDYTGKMNLVSLSEGDYLGHIGAQLNTVRLGSQAASVTLRYTLAEAMAFDVHIPVGSRASADGQLLWATTQSAVIEAGQLAVDVPATCLTPGTVGNGLAPGQINKFFDRITYVKTVANTTTSMGGADDESDDNFRARIQLAPERLSVCGPEGAYKYWARSVSSQIVDVAVWSPADGQIRVAPWCAGGQAPSADMLNAVHSAVTAEKRRPLTDKVQIVAPEQVKFTVSGTFYVRTSYATKAAQIQANVATALDSFVAWQKAKLGRDVSPDELISRVRGVGPGIQRVVLDAPNYQALDPWQVAICTSAELSYGGLADD